MMSNKNIVTSNTDAEDLEDNNVKSSKTNDDTDTLLVSVKEACKILGIGRNSLLKMIRLRRFPAIILPGKILIDKNELPNWLKQNYGKYEKWNLIKC